MSGRGHRQQRLRALRSGVAVIAGLACAASDVNAQGTWEPFGEQQGVTPPPRRPARQPQPEAPRPLPPMDEAPAWGQPKGPIGDRPANRPSPPDAPAPTAERGGVEMTDLPPITTNGDLPLAAGGGRRGNVAIGAALDWAKLSKEIAVPQRSPVLARMLLRLADDGDGPPPAPETIVPRAAMLYRAGRAAEADAGVAKAAADRSEPVLAALGMRLALAAGDRDRTCRNALAVVQDGAALPASVRGEAIAVQGYCGAASGNLAAAGLAAQLAREQGSLGADTLALLEAVAVGDPPRFTPAAKISVVDWRLAEITGKLDTPPPQLDKFDAATLRAIATSPTAGAWRVPAAEAAVRVNAIEPAELAEAYRQQSFAPGELAQGQAAKVDPALRRALLYRAAEAEQTPSRRTRLVRVMLDDARRVQLYRQVAASLVRIVEEIRPVPEIGWFAETAIEVGLAAERPDLARRWVGALAESAATASEVDRSSTQPLTHWLALIDIADPGQRQPRGASLGFVEEIALRGRFTPPALHRLATVLDALDYHVPVRLWEAASRSPQPTTGYLPATGLLPELQAAARKRDIAETITLAIKALGPEGPEGAHMIALGDVIRALKRAGLEPEARAVAAEALFALWPRSASN